MESPNSNKSRKSSTVRCLFPDSEEHIPLLPKLEIAYATPPSSPSANSSLYVPETPEEVYSGSKECGLFKRRIIPSPIKEIVYVPETPEEAYSHSRKFDQLFDIANPSAYEMWESLFPQFYGKAFTTMVEERRKSEEKYSLPEASSTKSSSCNSSSSSRLLEWKRTMEKMNNWEEKDL